MGSKFLGRAIFFGLGYLAGTRAGRERYAQIEAGARAIFETLRARYNEESADPQSSTSGTQASDYSDIKLGAR